MTDDDNQLIQQRRAKLAAMREGGNAFPNSFRPTHVALDLHTDHDGKEKAALAEEDITVSVAGRMMFCRIMGKASFADLQDVSGSIQLFFHQGTLGDEVYEAFKQLDVGDILGVTGTLFITKTGELSVKVKSVELLTKSLRPLPEKFHGLSDQETRYRQRYVDLMTSEETRNIFKLRSRVIAYIRQFFMDREFLEVETPMMQVIPGGAAAKPFVTHHNALDIDLYLRIAPELYLKRLVVGGFDRVFEINRNFRNEGLSTRHNPEFTMLEFYQAYADYRDLMDLTELLFRGLAKDVVGTLSIPSENGDRHYDFEKPFTRLSMFDSILAHNPTITADELGTMEGATAIAKGLHIDVKPNWGLGKVQTEIFDSTVEENLMDPTFITMYPTEVSPLSRRNDDDPFVRTDLSCLWVAVK